MTAPRHKIVLLLCCLTQGACLLFTEIETPPETGSVDMTPDARMDLADMSGDTPDQAIASEDMAPGEDLGGEDMLAPEDMVSDMGSDIGVDMGADAGEDLGPVAPEGWWDAMWTRRVSLRALKSWDGEIVLPVRVPGNASNDDGRELQVVLDGQSEPLKHETERWISEVDNVIWVRFPEGLTQGETIWVYGHRSTPLAESTSSPGDVWRGIARHVYHFDGGDSSILEHDSVEDQANHLAIPNATMSSAISYSFPNAQMGQRINLDGTLDSLESQGATSPMSILSNQDTTYEVHMLFQSYDDPGSSVFLSDENGCVGTTLFVGRGTFGVRHSRGESCEAMTTQTGQTILDYPQPDSRIYLNTPYLLFATFTWSEEVMPDVTLGAHAYSQSAANKQINRSTPTMISPPGGNETIPSIMEVGNWTFEDSPPHMALDTLIIHDRVISRDEMQLRWEATQQNSIVFERGAAESLP